MIWAILGISVAVLLIVSLWYGLRPAGPEPPAPSEFHPSPVHSDDTHHSPQFASSQEALTGMERTPDIHRTGTTDPEAIGAFEDQYTSATADLSAGGLAVSRAEHDAETHAPAAPGQMAEGGMATKSGASYGDSNVPPEIPVAPTPTGVSATRAPSAGSIYQAQMHESAVGNPIPTSPRPMWNPPVGEDWSARHREQPPVWRRPMTVGISAGTLFTLGSAVGGTWLYARWQRERNKPINRLRRRMRAVGNRVSGYAPDVLGMASNMPTPDPRNPRHGAGAGAVALALLAAAILRNRQSAMADTVAEATDEPSSGLGGGLLDLWRRLDVSNFDGAALTGNGRQLANRAASNAREMASSTTDHLSGSGFSAGPAPVAIGAIAAILSAVYLAWRMLNRQPQTDPRWVHEYTGYEAPIPHP